MAVREAEFCLFPLWPEVLGNLQAISPQETVIISVILSLNRSGQRGRLARLGARELIWDP